MARLLSRLPFRGHPGHALLAVGGLDDVVHLAGHVGVEGQGLVRLDQRERAFSRDARQVLEPRACHSSRTRRSSMTGWLSSRMCRSVASRLR